MCVCVCVCERYNSTKPVCLIQTVITVPFPRNHGNCRSDDVTRGSPSREMDKETKQEADIVGKCAISVQEEMREGELDTMSKE